MLFDFKHVQFLYGSYKLLMWSEEAEAVFLGGGGELTIQVWHELYVAQCILWNIIVALQPQLKYLQGYALLLKQTKKQNILKSSPFWDLSE